MATSMAAALAASMPAPTASLAPVAPTYENIPASMTKIIDSEAEIPITVVQLDALTITKIIKHCREATNNTAHGLLLGLDFDGTLEVSNCFPLLHPSGDDDEKSAKSNTRYQSAMLRSLKEVQTDDSVVGFYQASTLGAFYGQTLVETQALYQTRLRHGGIVLIHDLSQTARGNAAFRAFRLSKAFMSAYKKANFSATSLGQNKLTFSTIMEEITVKIRTNALLKSFVNSVSSHASSTPFSDSKSSSTDIVTGISPSYSHLDLGTGGINRNRNLEHIIEAVDNLRTEEGNLAYLHRQIARDKARADQYVAKRKEENAVRIGQGLAPLPEEDIDRLFKIPAEPNRLDSLLMMGQIDAYAKALAGTSSTGLVKMYAAKGA